MGFRTKQIHAGVTPDPLTGSILTPIYQTTTYVQDSVDEYLAKGFSYSRSGNPTVRALELKMTGLEDATDSVCFGTGMAAVQAVMLAFLNAGDHVIVSDVAYGGTYRLCTKILARFGVEFTFVDGSNLEEVAAAVRDNTNLIPDRDAGKSDHEVHRHRGRIEDRARRGCCACCRQHIPDAVLPAAAGAWCGYVHIQHDEVHGRSQRDSGRRSRLCDAGARRPGAIHTGKHRQHHVAAGCLVDAAGL